MVWTFFEYLRIRRIIVAVRRPKAGRPPKYIFDDAGNQVIGLSHDSSGRNNQYYTWETVDGKRQRKTFGGDKTAAIFRFRMWQDKQGRGKYEYFEYQDTAKQVLRDDGENLVFSPEPLIFTEKQVIPESILWARLRELLLRGDIHDTRRKLQLPGLEIKDAPSLKQSISLKEIGKLYDGRDNINWDQKRQARDIWTEFRKVIKKQYIAEITGDDILDYEAYAEREYRKRGVKPTWLRSRYNNIKAVLRYYLRRGRNSREELRRVIDLCETWQPPKKQTPKKTPLSKEHFQLLINNAKDIKSKLIYLLTLNCAYHSVDISGLKQDFIKRDNGNTYIDFPRQKTGEMRINVLFKETVEAYNEYIETYTKGSEYLFRNAHGGQLSPNSIRKIFNKDKERLNIPKAVKFDDFRDGAATYAYGCPDVQERFVRLFTGHAIQGELKKYVSVLVKMVKPCSDAVHKHYFS